jgi:cobalt-zinc-cadmium efflux system protein
MRGHDHDGAGQHAAHGVPHDHGREHAHDAAHAHGARAHVGDGGARRLMVALAILGTFTIVEAVGGYFANSIALLAEAAHMLADCASLLLAVIAVRVSQRPADQRRTYGHRRYQPLAAFVNGQVLLLLTAWVVYEAISRLMQLPAVNGRLMLEIALLGGLANLAAFLALSGARSLNERSARAHVLSDLLGSAAASVAALLILYRGWIVADPVLSLLVSVLIVRSAWGMIRESADVLLESVPARFDVARIQSVLIGQVPGLIDVHHVHVWSMTGELPTVTLHANCERGARHRETLTAIHARLKQQLHIEHITVQIEEEGVCETPDCVRYD